MPSFFEILIYIFYFYFICLSLKILHWIYKILLRPRKDLLNRYGNKSWALITGASDGIGKGFCEELARIGFNLILVARNESKLNTLAKDLIKINKDIETKVITFDFSTNTSFKDYANTFSK